MRDGRGWGRGHEGKRPICGFWIVEVGGLEEALGWVRKMPLEGRVVEVREIFECVGSGTCE